VPNPPVTFTEDAWYGGIGSAHNVAINEDTGFAYAIGASACSGGLHMIDISNPLNPTFAGCFSQDGYTHDVQCVLYHGPDAAYQGREICFASNEDTVTIVDVTNKAAPVQLSRNSYQGNAYTHQGWLTEDHRYFLLDDELDETSFGHNTYTRVWDVSDLNTGGPEIIGIFESTSPSIDHNQYVHEGYSYQSNYTSGLRILDLANVGTGNLTQAGFFDVYPQSDNPSFTGTWSNYPYFESGVVVVSSMDRGFFVVQPNLAQEPQSEISYIYRWSNGETGSGSFYLYADGSFSNTEGEGGRWAYDGSRERYYFQYDAGQFCRALFVGQLTNPTTMVGPMFCRDGTSRQGVWRGEIVSRTQE
jgi:choice-of-anchor B domain-containing protein